MRGGAAAPRARSPWVGLALVAAVLAAAAAVRWRHLDVPLERDEGEYAYMGQLLLRGIPPYERAYNMKLPGIYAAYAGVLAVFGQTARGIHLGLVVVNGLSILFLFLLARRLFDACAAAAAAAAFALLSMGFAVQGLFANAEHFVLCIALAGLWAAVRAEERGGRLGLVGAGTLLGIGFLMKQHGVFFVAAAGGALALGAVRRRPFDLKRAAGRLGLLGASSIAPFALTCLALALAGVFDKFWFWTFHYARAYTQRSTLAEAWPVLEGQAGALYDAAPGLWLLAGAGLVALALHPGTRRAWWVVVPFVALSAAAVFPGNLFRPHYFALTLPAAGLLAGAGVRGVAALLARARVPGLAFLGGLAVFVAALGHSLQAQRQYLFELTPYQVSRATYGCNPFPESIPIAERIRRETSPDDTIAVIGSEPQIYFYARRLSATGYIYTYALMEPQEFAEEMQQEMIREIEARRPEVLVWVNYRLSWLWRQESELAVIEWFRRYVRGYELISRVEVGVRGSRFLEAAQVDPGEPFQLSVDPYRATLDLYRRK